MNHPETIPPPPAQYVEKFSSMKLVPGAKKLGDLLCVWKLKSNVVHMKLIQCYKPNLSPQALALWACDGRGSPSDLKNTFRVILPLFWTVAPASV